MSDHKHELRLATLTKLDNGVFGAEFDRLLGMLVYDCFDRPALEKPRTLTMTLELRPVLDNATGKCHHVDADAKAQPKMPAMQANTAQMQPLQTGDDLLLQFSSPFPDSPDQLPLFVLQSEQNPAPPQSEAQSQ